MSDRNSKWERSTLLIYRQASHDELVKIEDACVDVDIVINAATSDDLELTKAINRGLAKGKADSNKSGVLVHVSGTQLIESRPTGRLEDVPKYDDLDVEQIKSIPDSALHRLIDLEYVYSLFVWLQSSVPHCQCD